MQVSVVRFQLQDLPNQIDRHGVIVSDLANEITVLFKSQFVALQ